MAFWTKSKKEKVVPQRIQRMASEEIIMWMDTSLMHLHRSYDEWRYRNGPSDIIDEYLEALTLMWEELANREKVR